MINVVCGIRSTGRICTDLATALEAQGHEVKIAYGREKVPEQFEKYAIRIGSDIDVNLHGLKARLFDSAGFGSKNATKKFIAWVKKYDPDVIHLHNIHGYYINVEILFDYLKKSGKKVIWTLHDCWAFTGHTAYCDSVGCMKWMTGCNKCPQIEEYPQAYIDCSKRNWKRKKKIFTGVKDLTIVTPSNWLANMVKKSFLAEYAVKVIHNGIDLNNFYPLANDFRTYFGLKNKFIILGVATAWDDMKGYSDFIKLSEKLNDSYKIVLVGLTANQKKNLPKKILGIEKTKSVKELAYIYNMADLFVNFSYCENYPTVNIEAMACGTPVLTYRTGGSVESIEQYGGGIIEKGDLQAAIDYIYGFKENYKKPSKISKENDCNFVIQTYLEQYISANAGEMHENLGGGIGKENMKWD